LLVMPFGNGSLRSCWITDCTNRNFDVVLLGYHTISDKEIITSTTVKVFHYHSYKWWMIQDFFAHQPEFLKNYTSFFFLDDDIEISALQITNLFECFNQLPIQLAQPSLTADSFMSWGTLRHRKYSGLRYVTTVELMCPLMKQESLETLLPTFKLTKSGWGVDLLWGKLIPEHFGAKQIAVLDIIQVRHNKPVGIGELYTKLDRPAKVEEDKLRVEHNLLKFKIKEIRSWWNLFPARWFSYYHLLRFKA
ncbi:MAG TPA: DUF707 domain-containing protein, partial [Cyclobacteriaceae bacterium]|nr:DUF707 domain-containing protein [Cyclobacteriaceae bacterium]